jgi:hypothetical protein
MLGEINFILGFRAHCLVVKNIAIKLEQILYRKLILQYFICRKYERGKKLIHLLSPKIRHLACTLLAAGLVSRVGAVGFKLVLAALALGVRLLVLFLASFGRADGLCGLQE